MELPACTGRCGWRALSSTSSAWQFPAFPGSPFRPYRNESLGGHQRHGDYQDLYREQLRREGDVVLALGPDGARPVLAQHEETILVRGSAAGDRGNH